MEEVEALSLAVHDGDVGLTDGSKFVALADVSETKKEADDGIAARLP